MARDETVRQYLTERVNDGFYSTLDSKMSELYGELGDGCNEASTTQFHVGQHVLRNQDTELPLIAGRFDSIGGHLGISEEVWKAFAEKEISYVDSSQEDLYKVESSEVLPADSFGMFVTSLAISTAESIRLPAGLDGGTIKLVTCIPGVFGAMSLTTSAVVVRAGTYEDDGALTGPPSDCHEVSYDVVLSLDLND